MLTTNRSTNIKSRVIRNLRIQGIDVSRVQDEEIYDALMLGQNSIIARAYPERILTVCIQQDEDSYLLTTGREKVNDKGSYLRNIGSVKCTKTPEGWRYPFQIIPNSEFIKIVNGAQAVDYDWDSIIKNFGWEDFDIDFHILKQPLIGTIIQNELKVYPTPSADYDGDELEFYVYLKSAAGVINEKTEPDLDSLWDYSLEQFATAQFLQAELKASFMAEHLREVRDNSVLEHRKEGTRSRPAVW